MDVIADALSLDGLFWLLGAALLAGIVRGFSGFGTAMVYMPVAAQILGPVEALTTLIIIDFFGPLPLLPRGWRDANRPELWRLGLGLIVALPVGVLFLTSVPVDVFRYAVSLIALTLLALLIAGVRYRGPFTPALLFGTGGLGGFLSGSVGLGGPPVIMPYLASPKPPSVIRANTLLFLFLTDVSMFAILGLTGLLNPDAVVIGLVLAVPYTVAMVLGARAFRPEAERVYRVAAYSIIALSALSGLPLLD